MFGLSDQPEADAERRLIPLESRGVKIMSMGLLTSKETPVIWRGPMATRLIQQFLSGVAWGELDYLVIDLPPGTGDVQLTLTQSVPLTGAVIVTTPQDVARTIAEKGLRMFQPVQVPVLGVIENMSYFVCSHCQEKTFIFRQGGGKQISDELGIPFLGEIPIDPEVVLAGDEGVPIVARNPSSPAALAYREIASKVASAVARANFESGSAKQPKEMVGEARALRIVWNDGSESAYPYDFLRNHCPCALCVDEWTGKRKSLILLLPSNFRAMKIDPVGNYAIQIGWSDGHNTRDLQLPAAERAGRRAQEEVTQIERKGAKAQRREEEILLCVLPPLRPCVLPGFPTACRGERRPEPLPPSGWILRCDRAP